MFLFSNATQTISSNPGFKFYSCFPLQPFLEKDNPILAYFPDYMYAVTVPITLFVIIVALVAIFVSIVMIRDARKERAKSD